jgi:hypothetical protein
MSYGVNDMRDGVNLSRLQVTRPLVMHTEVTNLPNMAGFLRFGRNLPVIRFQDIYNKVPGRQAAFVERRDPARRMVPGADPVPDGGDGAAARPEAGEGASRPTPRRRRHAMPDPATAPELPLPPPGEARRQGSTGPATERPVDAAAHRPVIALGRRSGFALRQHDRTGGGRNPAKPA